MRKLHYWPCWYGCFMQPAAAWLTPQPGNRNTNMPETTDNPSLSSGSVKLVEAYPNLAFNQPLDYRPANDDSGRVFVVEKSGKIWYSIMILKFKLRKYFWT